MTPPPAGSLEGSPGPDSSRATTPQQRSGGVKTQMQMRKNKGKDVEREGPEQVTGAAQVRPAEILDLAEQEARQVGEITKQLPGPGLCLDPSQKTKQS